MISNETNPFQIESQRAFVVYDPQSGSIVHTHKITTFKGGTDNCKDGEARAMELAKQFGHRIEGLRVLQVKPDDLEPIPQRLDLESKKLICAR